MDLEFRECEDYEPGEEYHQMHTDPLCRHCGAPKKEHRYAD